jgi:ComF family protein
VYSDDSPVRRRQPAGAGEAVFSSSEDRIRASRAIVQEAQASDVASSSYSRIPLRWASHAAESLFAVLFPSDCRICGAPLIKISRLPVCEECLAQIHPVDGTLCDLCGERVLSTYAIPASDGVIRCPVCCRIPPPFTRAVAYGSYEGGLRELIHLLKYSGVRPAANVLGRMLAEAIDLLDLDCASERMHRGSADSVIPVIPVPLHKAKRRERGFNQAELIARAALKLSASGLSLSTDVLERRRETSSQIGLTAHQRRVNLRGAFAVARQELIKDRHVLLVDDVLTTGATVSECARVLMRAGATRVWVATVARTLKFASQYAEIAPEVANDVAKDRHQAREAPMAKAVGS